MTAATHNPCQRGIRPAFYLIICWKPAGKTANYAGLTRDFPAFSAAFSDASAMSTRRFFNPLVFAPGALLPAMTLALSDVKRLAHLSRLELTEEQAHHTLEKLNSIFALVEQMQAIDTSGIEPLSHPIAAFSADVSLRLRDDVVTEVNQREAYQQAAPATQDGLYLVPKVIE